MKKLLVLALAVLMAAPAFAAVQNVKVSGNVTSAYVGRDRFDFGLGGEDYTQSFFYTSTHLRVDADLSDNVSATVGLANETPWGDQTPVTTNGATSGAQAIELDLANVTLREFLYSPLTLTVGRQVLAYGNSFLIGTFGGATSGGLGGVANDISKTLNYDGIKAVLDYKPLTLDFVYAKVNSRNLVGSGLHRDDQDLYGMNANYQLGDAMNTVVEGYFWTRIDRTAITGTEADRLYVPGLRVSTNPISGLNVSLEAAKQYGNVAAAGNTVERSDVWGLQTKMSYSLPVEQKYKPTVFGSYTWVSGDEDSTDTKSSAWDPMFNDQNLGTRIWRSLMSYTNLQVAELGVSVAPLEDVTAKLSWTGLWVNEVLAFPSTTAFTLPDGTTPTFATSTNNKQLGNEIDAELTYQYTEDVTFGLNVGAFKPGEAFGEANNSVAKQAIVSVGVNF